jgi:hypothetical protein
MSNEEVNTQEKHRLECIWSILSGGGQLEMRVDKAIRKIEKWYPEMEEEV